MKRMAPAKKCAAKLKNTKAKNSSSAPFTAHVGDILIVRPTGRLGPGRLIVPTESIQDCHGCDCDHWERVHRLNCTSVKGVSSALQFGKNRFLGGCAYYVAAQCSANKEEQCWDGLDVIAQAEVD